MKKRSNPKLHELIRECTREEAERQDAPASSASLDAGFIRRNLERWHGKVWTLAELTREYEVEAYAIRPNKLVARHRESGVRGTFAYRVHPCLFWNWTPDPK